jgi:hypothetical protein
MFSVLADSDSDSEKKEEVVQVEAQPEAEVAPEEKPESPPFRVWKTDDDAKRFFSDTTNIFSSPFSRKKKKNFTKEDTDGWVSIQLGNKDDMPELKLPPQEFPSMLQRGKGEEEINALAWAEKVKHTLERAGQRREKLSFFRRSVTLDEKF